jgi:hypothetical protein
MVTGRSSSWGRMNPPIDQTEEEIARAAKVEITQAERAMRNIGKAAEKDMHHHETVAMAPEICMKRLGMTLPSRGTTLSSIDIARLIESGCEHEVDRTRRNLAGSSGKASRSTTSQPIMPFSCHSRQIHTFAA